MPLSQADMLLSKGIRPSVQRLAVYDYLVKHPVHPTVDKIYQELSGQMPTLSKTTIYNTLKLFVSNNLIQSINIEDDELRYDANISNHIHFKCMKCKKIFDFFTDLQIPLVPEGFEQQKFQTNVWGICKDCSD